MNKLITTAFIIANISVTAYAQDDVFIKQQIESAIKAAPEEEKANCKVAGYDTNGVFKIIREGSNKTICLADDPNQTGYNVACYHQDLEPFMARGRELKKEGKSFKEIFDIRESEAKSGVLAMPKGATTLHIFSGKTADDATYRWVVYIPFATAESTGLPTKPIIAGAPWIMDPGTHRAHIMISPPNN